MEIIRKIILELKSPIFQNSFFLLLDKIGKLGNFIAVLLIARQYGPTVFGEFSYAFAFVSILGSFSDLGIKNVLIKFLVKDSNEQNDFLGSSFILIMASSLCCVVVGIAYTFVVKDSDLIHRLIKVLCLSYLLKPFYTIFYFYESKIEVRKVVPFMIFNTTICLVLKIMLILNHADIITFGYITLVEAIIEAMILIIVFTKNNHSMLNWTFKKSTLKILLKESLPLFISGIMIIVYMRIDQIMLQKLSNTHELANYSLCVKITEFFYVIPTIIVPSLFPKLVKLNNDNTIVFYEFLKNCYRFLSGISYIFVIFIFCFANIIINSLVTDSFDTASNLLRLLSFSIFMVSLGSLQNSFINIINRNKILITLTFAGAIINILLNLYLIPLKGALGAVYATLISNAFIVFFIPFFIKDTKQQAIFSFNSLLFPVIKIPK